MIEDDPFAEDSTQHTVIRKPTPGGRRHDDSPFIQGKPAATPRPEVLQSTDRHGLNPLENAASAVLNLLTSLKNTRPPNDIAGLQRRLVQEIQSFEGKARDLGVADQLSLTRARYILCATLDDIILNTRWAQEFGWAKKTLQGTFFKKEWAGNEFFQLLDTLLQDPSNNRQLLELMYLCLALGFQGEYRVYDRHNELEDRRESLYRALRNLRAEEDQDLSPHWRGIRDPRNPITRYIPLWVLCSVAALLLLLLYFFFYFRLTSVSDPVFVGLQTVGEDIAVIEVELPPDPDPEVPVRKVPEPEPAPNPEPIHQQLRAALANESCFQVGELDASSGAAGTFIRTVTSEGCGALFASGQWEIEPQFKLKLETVASFLAEAIERSQGTVLVAGHTDNLRGKFIDNNELSQRRAVAVQNALVAVIGSPGRFRAVGRGAREPVVSNDTAQGRTRNRRVEIMLLYPYQR